MIRSDPRGKLLSAAHGRMESTLLLRGDIVLILTEYGCVDIGGYLVCASIFVGSAHYTSPPRKAVDSTSFLLFSGNMCEWSTLRLMLQNVDWSPTTYSQYDPDISIRVGRVGRGPISMLDLSQG